MELTNECKAEIFFNTATVYLDLMQSNRTCYGYIDQTRPIVQDHYGVSPYICDAIYAACNNAPARIVTRDSLYKEMNSFGMPQTGFNIWDHIPAEERQEARWFFLMLMVEYLDDADNE